MEEHMKKSIIFTAIIASLFILNGPALAESPATSYYTTTGLDPVTDADEIPVKSPPCPEGLRVYGEYTKTTADEPCDVPKRFDRIWICNDGTGNQGLDVKYLPAEPCR
jgi:hypothetical protein